MQTPTVFRRVSGSMRSKGADHHGLQRQRRQRKAGAGRDGKTHRDVVETKNNPKKQSPSVATTNQSLRGGHRTRNRTAAGSTHRKPMSHRRMTNVIGSALRPDSG